MFKVIGLKFTSMTRWQEESWSVAREARMTRLAATVEGQKLRRSWSSKDSTAR